MPSRERGSESPCLQVARFSGEKPAGRAYRKAQDLLFATPDCELSAFRFHLDRIWHVAVLGDQPPDDLDRQLRALQGAALFPTRGSPHPASAATGPGHQAWTVGRRAPQTRPTLP